MKKNKLIKKLKEKIQSLQETIEHNGRIIKHKNEQIELEQKWGEDANKECIRYAKEIEYKTQLLKNIISTP